MTARASAGLPRAIDHLAKAQRRFWGMALLVVLMMALAAPVALSEAWTGPPVGIDLEESVVTSVAVGSALWVIGIRPGQAFVPWTGPDVAHGVDVALPDESYAGVGLDDPFDPAGPLLGAAAFALIALLAFRFGLPGVSAAVGLSSAVALSSVMPLLGVWAGLIATPAAAVGALLASIATANSLAQRQQQVALAFPKVGVLVAGEAVIAASLLVSADWPWRVLWLMPLVVVVAMSVVGVIASLRSALSRRGQRLEAFVRLTIPAAGAWRDRGSADERKRLVAELHDHVLPELGQAMWELDSGSPARSAIDGAVRRIRSELMDRQTLALEIDGLSAAVASYASYRSTGCVVECAVATDGRAPADVEQAVYRVFLLALTNAIQHASASAIDVELDETAQRVDLLVRDDGVGLDDLAESEAVARGHLGLAEMRAVAQSIGARLEIEGISNDGTRVRLSWAR